VSAVWSGRCGWFSEPVIYSAASAVYGALVRQRRAWYARNPARQRHLRNPVISVGNLSVGGSGKTPVVEHLARILLGRGERPSILSRGYARRVNTGTATIVADSRRIIADLDHAGDEPLMLARALPGVPVVVGPDRYAAGRVAEDELGATVHILDDGFQHMALARDINLLVVHQADLADRVLPAGRLREPLSAAAAADAVLTNEAGSIVRSRLGVATAFSVRRTLGPVQMVSNLAVIQPATVGPVFALAGIARPERVFEDLQAAGWRLGGTLSFRDHHRYTQADVNKIADAVRKTQSHVVVTTSKDLVRLEPLDCTPLALAVAPLMTTIDPEQDFNDWLNERLSKARSGVHAKEPPGIRTGQSGT
jgi:tetraacyldisaccharide 4'-kinase